MSDDLNLLLTMVSAGNHSLFKVAVKVPGGLNNFQDWMYFKEEEVLNKYHNMFPTLRVLEEYVIVEVIELGDVIMSATKPKE